MNTLRSGSPSHYAADSHGHPMAVNRAVPLFYPKLGLKFGKVVTYADDPHSHSKTEFAFDVFQAAKGRYASADYKRFIGFEVAKPLLERAFEDTYGMRLENVFMNVDLAIGSYRRAVGTVLPAMTRVAWQLKKQEIRKDAPSATRKAFLYNLSRSSYEKDWGSTYQRPGVRSKVLAFLLRVMPKVGPFRPLDFKRLTPETEKMYMASFNSTVDHYRELLSEQNAGRLKPPTRISTWERRPGRGNISWRMPLIRNCCTGCKAAIQICRRNCEATFSLSTMISTFPSRPRPTATIGAGCYRSSITCNPWMRTSAILRLPAAERFPNRARS